MSREKGIVAGCSVSPLTIKRYSCQNVCVGGGGWGGWEPAVSKHKDSSCVAFVPHRDARVAFYCDVQGM